MNQLIGLDYISQHSSRVKERQIRSYTINIRSHQSPKNSQEKRLSTIIQPPNSFRQINSDLKNYNHNCFQKSTQTNKQLRIQHKKYYQQQYYDKTSKQILDQQQKVYRPFIDISQITQISQPLPIIIYKKNELIKFKSQRPQFTLN
ncbi:unnamed protein product [Paramecium sonneborni]|uniref:Uncharacterized protein n=1 Tax=Paramecium sonneborni TaxID=65129 RepID=A0A8S1PTM5_9CILI|nr:unnamed protein product [Paramecium sonneborni]